MAFTDSNQLSILKEDYSVGKPVNARELFISGSTPVIGTSYSQSMIPINQQLNEGERWFMTFYTNIEDGFDSSTLNPFTSTSSPFGQKGVCEIAGIGSYTANNGIFILFKDTFDPPIWNVSSSMPTSNKTQVELGYNNLGFLMWKGRASGDNEFVIVQDSITGGVGAGAFTSKYTTEEITDNFENITKTYGANQTG
jgi:hypothetical protein